jgi:plasmid maintenance system antidote protein VapI
MNLSEVRTILIAKLAQNITFTQLAQVLGVSRQRANQIKEQELNDKQIIKIYRMENV